MTLRDLRDGIGRPGPPMTQATLATLASINQGFISQIERGEREPSPRILWRIAQALGVEYETVIEASHATRREHR